VGLTRIVLAVQALRALLYGFGAVMLGSVFAAEHLSPVAAGAVFTATLVGMAGGSLLIGRFGDAIGARRLYAGLFVLLGVAGTVVAISSWLPLLILAALTGTISTDANESGPITSLEQAMLSATPSATRARTFGRYNAVAYLAGAIGALAAGAPTVLRHLIPPLPPDQRWFLSFPVVAVICVVLALRLPPDAATTPHRRGQRRLDRSRRNVRRLAALFSLDSFAGGLIVQSFVVYWFEAHFGASVELMATVFFGVGVLQAASSLVAPVIARHAGLLYTMVFTHLPSNVLLALIPFMPTLPIAIMLLVIRAELSQMDVPTRQAYLAALVDQSERTAAAAYTNSARYAARPIAPVAAGALTQASFVALPFVVAGGLKCLYDVATLLLFRHVAIESAHSRSPLTSATTLPPEPVSRRRV
jgi:MFS family permease